MVLRVSSSRLALSRDKNWESRSPQQSHLSPLPLSLPFPTRLDIVFVKFLLWVHS